MRWTALILGLIAGPLWAAEQPIISRDVTNFPDTIDLDGDLEWDTSLQTILINGVALTAVGTGPTNSGAALIGIFDEFASSNGTTVQDVIDDLDAAIAALGVGPFQPLDATLTALAGLDATAGILVQTGADAFSRRTLQAPAAGLTISNPAGTAGDPTFALANDLAALEGMSGTGLVARTASETYAQRTLTGDTEIVVADGDGVAGNPTLSIASSIARDSELHDAVTLSTDLGNNLLGLSTQQLTLDSQNANVIFAGPTSGGAAAPTFRSMVDADIPSAIARDSELHSAVTVSGTPDYITLVGQDIVRGTVDISDDTNLAGDSEIVLTGDALSLASSIARDSELPVGANPTATVNGTAANGVATSFLRSDGAPALADPLQPADGTQNITGSLTASSALQGATVTGTGSADAARVQSYSTAGDARVDIRNDGNTNYSAVTWTRERSTGAGVMGAAARVQSNTGSISPRWELIVNTSIAADTAWIGSANSGQLGIALDRVNSRMDFLRAGNAAAATFPINLNMQDDQGSPGEHTYAQILTTLDDPTNGSEDGSLTLKISVAGTLTNWISSNSSSDLVVQGDVRVNGNDLRNSANDVFLTASGTDVSVPADLTAGDDVILNSAGAIVDFTGAGDTYVQNSHSGDHELWLRSNGGVRVHVDVNAEADNESFQVVGGAGTSVVTIDENGHIDAVGYLKTQSNYIRGSYASSQVLQFDGTTGATSAIGFSVPLTGGSVIDGIYTGTATLNFADRAPSTEETLTITVTGAATGDTAIVNWDGTVEASLTAYGRMRWWVSAANTVSVTFSNCDDPIAGSNINPASGTFRATVISF